MEIKSLSEIVDQTDYLSNKSELGINEYNLIFDFRNQSPKPYYHLKFYIINKLPIEHFNKVFNTEISYLKNLRVSEIFLSEYYRYPGEYFELTLYEIIKKYGKIPNNIIDNCSVDIYTHISNYESKKFLERYFQNKGKVFFSESMDIIYEHRFENIAPILVEKGILRRGKPNELSEVLNYKTKNEILSIIKNNFIKINIDGSSNSISKKYLIKLIEKEEQIINLNIPEYFYFLSDNYQNLKEWLVQEEIYFKVFCFLNQDIESAYIGIDGLMRDLIKIKEFSIAEMIGKLYFNTKLIFKEFRNYDEVLTDEKVNKQLRKLK